MYLESSGKEEEVRYTNCQQSSIQPLLFPPKNPLPKPGGGCNTSSELAQNRR